MFNALIFFPDIIVNLANEISKIGSRSSTSMNVDSKYYYHDLLYLVDLDCPRAENVLALVIPIAFLYVVDVVNFELSTSVELNHPDGINLVHVHRSTMYSDLDRSISTGWPWRRLTAIQLHLSPLYSKELLDPLHLSTIIRLLCSHCRVTHLLFAKVIGLLN